MSAIDDVFVRCAEEKRAAFIPYLTGGDPNLKISAELMAALVTAGADILEIGVPFSDPIADGPVNQRAAMRALAAGASLPAVLDLVARHRSQSSVPVVLFSYFNPILARGIDEFARQAADSGLDGVLCVDLPPSEAARELTPALESHDIDRVFLLAPTSTKNRIQEVGDAATGFVYYVSRTGVTGVQATLETELKRDVKRLRRRVDQPVAVGFGISTPEQVSTVARFADGVVVGSALVRLVEEHGGAANLVDTVRSEAARLAAATRRSKRLARG